MGKQERAAGFMTARFVALLHGVFTFQFIWGVINTTHQNTKTRQHVPPLQTPSPDTYSLIPISFSPLCLPQDVRVHN